MDRVLVLWLTPNELAEYGPDDDFPAKLGAKARGLLWLPKAWVPPFFVISPDVYSHYKGLVASARAAYLESLVPRVALAFERAGIGKEANIVLRSNAVKETADERGRYPTLTCTGSSIIGTLCELYERVVDSHPDCEFGVVVQLSIPTIVKGHLSNARRVAKEYRDALIELESAGGDISERRIVYRQWRRDRAPAEEPLICRSEMDIANSLRPVLAYAARSRRRVHFEWVWDGTFIHIVQADGVDEAAKGIGPDVPLKGRIHEAIALSDLSCFMPVQAGHADSTGKLRNHALYAKHGFWQPVFYQLADQRIISAVLNGEQSDALDKDLQTLTRKPLVIRTSSSAGRSPLLPRSHQLSTVQKAKEWLYGEFASRLKEKMPDISSISLLAHHYVPARVAAFSLGHSDRLDVQVQSLWGIPEGLYYYPYDAFSIHTVVADPKALTAADYSRFQFAKKIRFKSHFVAPNEEGTFVRHELVQPWDWKATIGDTQTLAKMAAFSRLLAHEEGCPVNIMWFVDCMTENGVIDAVPWYHEALESSIEGVYFQRNSQDEDIVISTEDDLARLERREVVEGQEARRSRLVVRLSPVEDRAIRNEEFAERVGLAAKRLDAAVVLNGATLSHVYYVLLRTGVHLSVQSLTDAIIRPEFHGKLVRDKIPATVAASGEMARVATLGKEHIAAALRLKLIEEALEVKDASREEIASELADVIEVVRGLAKTSDISLAEIERLRRKKAERRGGFSEGLMLLATGGKDPSPGDPTLLDESKVDHSRVVYAPVPPLESVRMGAADVRDTPRFFEHIQDAVVPLTHIDWMLESPTTVSLPKGSMADTMSWSITGRRVGTSLRLKIKIRVGTDQLELPFEQDLSDTES